MYREKDNIQVYRGETVISKFRVALYSTKCKEGIIYPQIFKNGVMHQSTELFLWPSISLFSFLNSNPTHSLLIISVGLTLVNFQILQTMQRKTIQSVGM